MRPAGKRVGADFSPKAPEPREEGHLYVERETWRKVKVAAAKRGVAMKLLADTAVRVLLAILEDGMVPDDLGQLLRRKDPVALDRLVSLARMEVVTV